MRIGHGYDVHRLQEGRRLILGGVEIPFDKVRLSAPRSFLHPGPSHRNL